MLIATDGGADVDADGQTIYKDFIESRFRLRIFRLKA